MTFPTIEFKLGTSGVQIRRLTLMQTLTYTTAVCKVRGLTLLV
jgi:hypothetical protein